jgi:hypothetical protein
MTGRVDAIVHGVGNYDVSRWLSVVPYPYTTNDDARFLKTTAQRVDMHGVSVTQMTSGCIGVDDELGWFARPVRRAGLWIEAAQAVVAHWFCGSDHNIAGLLLPKVTLGCPTQVSNDWNGATQRPCPQPDASP